jgi:hypothetical protein
MLLFLLCCCSLKGSLLQYCAGITDSHQLPKVTFATPESTGIPALPAEFWKRTLCLKKISGVVMTASSVYNPNTNKGRIAIRAIAGLDRLKLKTGNKGNGVLIKKSTFKAPSESSIAADSQALCHAMPVPPASMEKNKADKKRGEKTVVLDCVDTEKCFLKKGCTESPIVADSQALCQAMQVPPVSIQKKKTNQKRQENTLVVDGIDTSLLKVPPESPMAADSQALFQAMQVPPAWIQKKKTNQIRQENTVVVDGIDTKLLKVSPESSMAANSQASSHGMQVPPALMQKKKKYKHRQANAVVHGIDKSLLKVSPESPMAADSQALSEAMQVPPALMQKKKKYKHRQANAVVQCIDKSLLKVSPESPMAADSQALSEAMQVPPALIQRKKTKKKRQANAVVDGIDNSLLKVPPESSMAANSPVSSEAMQEPPALTPKKKKYKHRQANAVVHGIDKSLLKVSPESPMAADSQASSHGIQVPPVLIQKRETNQKRQESEIVDDICTNKLLLKVPPESPMAADSQALPPPMPARPALIQKTNEKRQNTVVDETAFSSTSVLGSHPLKLGKTPDGAVVSPEKEMVTLFRPPSGEATRSSLRHPPKVSKPLHPKIPSSSHPVVFRSNNVAQSLQKTVKKRKTELPHDNQLVMNERAPKVAKLDQLFSEDMNNLKNESMIAIMSTVKNATHDENQETAFYVSTTATIPIANTATSFKRRRQMPHDDKYSDEGAARLLTDLKLPLKESFRTLTNTANSVSSGQDSVKQIRHLRDHPIHFAAKLSLPQSVSGPSQSARESFKREKVTVQYIQVLANLKQLKRNSASLMHARNMRGPTLSLTAGNSNTIPQHKYSKLLAEHQAAHESIQRCLLRSAETTLRLLLDDEISVDEARADLKESIKRFEGILYDTLRRHQMERDAFLAQHQSLKKSVGVANRMSSGEYPCQSAFAKVEELCAAITRPVGRPKSIVSPPDERIQ